MAAAAVNRRRRWATVDELVDQRSRCGIWAGNDAFVNQSVIRAERERERRRKGRISASPRRRFGGATRGRRTWRRQHGAGERCLGVV